jgi:hypothetical protein
MTLIVHCRSHKWAKLLPVGAHTVSRCYRLVAEWRRKLIYTATPCAVRKEIEGFALVMRT